MERSRQNVRGGKPNIATVHHLVPDGAPDGASRATNHPLYAHAGCPLRQPHPHGLVARIARPRATRTARSRAQLAAARKRS
jgi:hypothetical protein